MKTDLTNLPPDQQIGHVVAHVVGRLNRAGGRPMRIYATDLMDHFKHRGAGYGTERLRYFSGLLATANKVIAQALGSQEPAAPKPASPAIGITDGTP